MKILILYTYNKGYLSSFFFELSTRLSRVGHDVVNFSLKTSKKSLLKDNVEIIISKKGGYVSNYFQIYKTIKKVKPDVILSNFSYVNPALLCGKLLGVKKNMVWFHSLNEQMQSSALDIYVKKKFLRLAENVIANSFFTKEELKSFYKVPEEKVKAIPFWSNISEQNTTSSNKGFHSNKGVIKIGCPGRIAKHKNQKVVIEALSTLKEKYSFHLYFAGVGEELANLEKLVVKLNLSERVTFLKHVSANDMTAFYHAMDVIVLPSLHEAFGLVFIEAISLGAPVIVSSQFGALNFIQNENKQEEEFTFNPESPNELSEKLLPYLKKEGQPRDYFIQLYKKNFDKEVIFKDILEIIKTD